MLIMGIWEVVPCSHGLELAEVVMVAIRTVSYLSQNEVKYTGLACSGILPAHTLHHCPIYGCAL